MTTVALADPSGSLFAHSSNAEGDLIDSLRNECGFILQAVDWIARKLGYDLVGAIMDPIAGDFSAVDGMRMDWQSTPTPSTPSAATTTRWQRSCRTCGPETPPTPRGAASSRWGKRTVCKPRPHT